MPTAQQQQALLAQQPPTAPTNALQGVNQAFQATTPEQSAALAGINKQFAPQTGTPPVVDISNPTQQIEIPTTPEPRVDAERVSAGLTPFIEEQKAMEAKAQARIDEGQDISNQLLRQLSPETQTQEFRDLEQERLGPIQGDIKDSLTRLESIRSGYEAQLIREEQAPGGTAIGALSRTNQIKVNQAREELPIIATIQYQQGQLSDARQSIDTMFNIQRDALETQLNYVSSFIAKNEDKLSNAQRNKLDIALAEEQRRVDEGTALIDDQKAAAEYATGLIPRMDKESIAELQKDITRGMGYQEALAKYGQFEGVETESEALDLERQRLSNQNTNLQIAGQRINNAQDQEELDSYRIAQEKINKAIESGDRPTETGDEDYTTGGYALRSENSNIIAVAYEDNVFLAGGPVPSIKDGLKYRAGKKLPKEFQGPAYKSYFQSQLDFVSAVLRKESGAAITPDEYASEGIKYFAQPGDDQTVIEQKQQARAVSMNALTRGSKGGYEQLMFDQLESIYEANR